MINSLLLTYKRTTLANSLIIAISLGLFVFTSVCWLSNILAINAAIASIVVSLITSLRTKQFLKVSSRDFLEHINRSCPEYQESAQLLEATNSLSTLQLLQKKKVEEQFRKDLTTGKLQILQPQVKFFTPFLLLIFSLINFSLGDELRSLFESYNSQNTNSDIATNQDKANQKNSPTPTLISHKIDIEFPSYTNKAPISSSQLDIEALQGSNIKGVIEFSRPELEYFYSRSGKPPTAMTRQQSKFTFHDKADQTALYKFSYKAQDKLVELDGIYTITVIRDTAAKVTIIEPRTTLLEYGKSETPRFSINANIKDDFGVSDVKILASVAKGSGEAVKFRDKIFRFKATDITPQENLSTKTNRYFQNANYQKSWSLNELQMEPGDEAYFSLHVLDNKQPEHQLSKSSSIIVRWLDDDDIELALEGILIRFVPEYFRSQRQIIIETEQLIADGKDFDRDKFEEISTDLGRSQSDLKQKYGQYLGDEFGEGQGAQLGLADGYHGGETMSSGEASAGLDQADQKNDRDSHSGEEHSEDHHLEQDRHSQNNQLGDSEHGHQHHDDDNSASNDLSGAQQLIDQFGHKHSSIEVAPLSSKDPKSWMKMAVNEMWQAELHLMMSEPVKALPYEYQAYKYLKLARQAERVYAKRLGFEPPPVSEERRLTGELKAILEYDLVQVDSTDSDSDSELFRTTYQMLNKLEALSEPVLTEEQQSTLSNTSQRLLALSEKRPVLVKYAAISEKLALAKTLELKNCGSCASDLKAKLWQLIPTPLSRPMRANKRSNISDGLRKHFIEASGDAL